MDVKSRIRVIWHLCLILFGFFFLLLLLGSVNTVCFGFDCIFIRNGFKIQILNHIMGSRRLQTHCMYAATDSRYYSGISFMLPLEFQLNECINREKYTHRLILDQLCYIQIEQTGKCKSFFSKYFLGKRLWNVPSSAIDFRTHFASWAKQASHWLVPSFEVKNKHVHFKGIHVFRYAWNLFNSLHCIEIRLIKHFSPAFLEAFVGENEAIGSEPNLNIILFCSNRLLAKNPYKKVTCRYVINDFDINRSASDWKKYPIYLQFWIAANIFYTTIFFWKNSDENVALRFAID